MKKNIAPLTPEEKYLLEVEEQRQKKILNDVKNAGHAKPTTRRDFLGSGLTTFAGYLAAPTILQLLSSEVAAAGLTQECKTLFDPKPGMMPYVHVNLSGGAAMAGAVLPLDKNGQVLKSYARCGLGTTANFTTKTEFGGALIPCVNGVPISQISNGLLQAATSSAIAKTAFVPFYVRSQDDSSANRVSIMGMVNAAGARGITLPNIGTTTGQSFKNPSAFIIPNPPQNIQSIGGLLGALTPGNRLRESLKSASHRDALLNLVKNLTASQRKNIASTASGKTLGQLAECATGKNIEVADINSASLDPRGDSSVAPIWGINATTLETDDTVVMAALAFNTINGNSGACLIDLGGYDVHQYVTREEQDAVDLKAGILLGRIISTAEVLGKSVFIHVTSDGSVESGNSEIPGARFGADSGSRGGGYIIVYHPNQRPVMTGRQIGAFNATQSVDETIINTW
ncbi:MAG: hypothetical protein V4736_07290, partial [Bdellovibrionota bacterium]